MKKYRRFLLSLAGLAVAAALSLPFFFWYRTWFGRPLSDAEIGTYLQPDARPRDTQHALSQLAAVIERGDSHAQRWYPEMVALSRHKDVPVRAMAAWAMGQDKDSPLFHQSLLAALRDPAVMVRRNAALALVRFGDASGRAELVRILQSAPDEEQAWEALRGLYIVGQPADLAAVEAYRRNAGNASAAIRSQVEITAQVIRSRSPK